MQLMVCRQVVDSLSRLVWWAVEQEALQLQQGRHRGISTVSTSHRNMLPEILQRLLVLHLDLISL